MTTIAFDTLKYVKQLEASGVPPVQAEAFVNAQRDILSEALDSTLATKSDVSDIKVELAVMKWMIGFNLAFTMAVLWKMFN